MKKHAKIHTNNYIQLHVNFILTKNNLHLSQNQHVKIEICYVHVKDLFFLCAQPFCLLWMQGFSLIKKLKLSSPMKKKVTLVHKLSLLEFLESRTSSESVLQHQESWTLPVKRNRKMVLYICTGWNQQMTVKITMEMTVKGWEKHNLKHRLKSFLNPLCKTWGKM